MQHLHESARGRATHRLSVVVIAVLAAVAMLAPGSAAQEQDAQALLQRAGETMAAVQSFHFEFSTPEGKSLLTEEIELQSLEGDVQRPDRFRAAFTAKASFLSITIKVVGIGNRLWVTDPREREEVYVELTIDGGDGGEIPLPDIINPDRLIRTAIAAIQNPVVADTQKIEGVETTRIDGAFDPAAVELAGTPVPELAGRDPLPIRLWIDEAGHVVRLEFDGPFTDAEDNNVVRRIDLTKFDESFDIQPPTA